MKELPIRKFTAVYEFLADDTLITKDGQPVGVYTPIDVWNENAARLNQIVGGIEKTVDDIAKKAIEPEQVKVRERPGKPPELSKGLGDIPGVQRGTDGPSFGTSRPAPKPKK